MRYRQTIPGGLKHRQTGSKYLKGHAVGPGAGAPVPVPAPQTGEPLSATANNLTLAQIKAMYDWPPQQGTPLEVVIDLLWKRINQLEERLETLTAIGLLIHGEQGNPADFDVIELDPDDAPW